jgi:hypothetical protein
MSGAVDRGLPGRVCCRLALLQLKAQFCTTHKAPLAVVVLAISPSPQHNKRHAHAATTCRNAGERRAGRARRGVDAEVSPRAFAPCKQPAPSTPTLGASPPLSSLSLHAGTRAARLVSSAYREGGQTRRAPLLVCSRASAARPRARAAAARAARAPLRARREHHCAVVVADGPHFSRRRRRRVFVVVVVITPGSSGAGCPRRSRAAAGSRARSGPGR